VGNKIYQIITDKILAELDAGNVPWDKPWHTEGVPKSFVTKKAYRGINSFNLNFSVIGNNWSRPYFLTFNQTKKLGAQVKKGSTSEMVIFWNFIEKKEIVAGQEKVVGRIPLLRYYRVFNIDQVEGLDLSKLPEVKKEKKHADIFRAETLIKGYKDSPKVIHTNKHRAYYSPLEDIINIPPKECFDNIEDFYSTHFHESVHSTLHQPRLNRSDAQHNFRGDYDYSKEELVAEMGAAFLCGMSGIAKKTIKNSAAYIDTWRQKISQDVKLVVCAAAKAQKAVDYITGVTFENEENK